MTKKGPLGKAEKFYIENNRDLSVGTLCKDLDRAKSTIEKFLKTLPKVVAEPEENVAPESKPETHTMSQFAKNGKGSTVMTQTASELGDSYRSKGLPARSQNCTTNIR